MWTQLPRSDFRFGGRTSDDRRPVPVLQLGAFSEQQAQRSGEEHQQRVATNYRQQIDQPIAAQQKKQQQYGPSAITHARSLVMPHGAPPGQPRSPTPLSQAGWPTSHVAAAATPVGYTREAPLPPPPMDVEETWPAHSRGKAFQETHSLEERLIRQQDLDRHHLEQQQRLEQQQLHQQRQHFPSGPSRSQHHPQSYQSRFEWQEMPPLTQYPHPSDFLTPFPQPEMVSPDAPFEYTSPQAVSARQAGNRLSVEGMHGSLGTGAEQHIPRGQVAGVSNGRTLMSPDLSSESPEAPWASGTITFGTLPPMPSPPLQSQQHLLPYRLAGPGVSRGMDHGKLDEWGMALGDALASDQQVG